MNQSLSAKTAFTFLFISLTGLRVFAQDNQPAPGHDVSLAAQKATVFTADALAEKWENVTAGINVSFAGSAMRIAKNVPPDLSPSKEWKTAAWRGEKIHTQIAAWGKEGVNDLTISVSDLKDKNGNMVKNSNVSTGFLGYVMTDEFRDGCGYRKPQDFDSSLVADLIDTRKSAANLDAETTQPIWLSISVPQNTVAGTYEGTVIVKHSNQPGSKAASAEPDSVALKITLTVVNRTLPTPDKWKYQLDLWQHPAAIARTHKVALWSKEHFDAMRPYYTMLAKAGQKCITASIVNEPWGHQTFDDYPGLIKWTKKKTGEWSYDYSLFDKYVSFVMSCGITGRINCYSMVPWKIAFIYYDEATRKEMVFTEAIGTPAYNEFWKPMLIDFASHLKKKNWFSKTAIAMDERPMPAMQSVIKLLHGIDAGWKISLAGEYHAEIEKEIYDYCVASKWQFPAEILARRKKEGKFSTWYTCCSEKYPNGFSFSPPDEHVWMGWYTAATGMEGYLRWAFNSWVENPFTDSRFRTWPAGDTYQVYPGALSSIRFEKIIEGVQDFEKISVLKAEYKKNGQAAKLKALDDVLKNFSIDKLATVRAADMVANAKPLLDE